jgi:hypothetical protein
VSLSKPSEAPHPFADEAAEGCYSQFLLAVFRSPGHRAHGRWGLPIQTEAPRPASTRRSFWLAVKTVVGVRAEVRETGGGISTAQTREASGFGRLHRSAAANRLRGIGLDNTEVCFQSLVQCPTAASPSPLTMDSASRANAGCQADPIHRFAWPDEREACCVSGSTGTCLGTLVKTRENDPTDISTTPHVLGNDLQGRSSAACRHTISYA